MKVALVGADFEENLGVGMIAAVSQKTGHRVVVVPFGNPEELDEVANRLVVTPADIIGLSMQFQHRASEFLGLAKYLRALGYKGHICCGGHFPTMEWRQVLSGGYGIDSVVFYEGEVVFAELLKALCQKKSISTVPGLAYIDEEGKINRTAPVEIVQDLDMFPHPYRYRNHAIHLGIPFIPISGSRGCWGSCSFCSITSVYRDARKEGGGKKLRYRSPEDIADEMARLWHSAGGPSIFCFHDDTFLFPRPQDSLIRLKRLREALDEKGVGKVALVGKCRPDCVNPEFLRQLKELGVMRLYVGIENASQDGANHLNRRTTVEKMKQALSGCRRAGIFVCYNLLIFEPKATLDTVYKNISFIKENASSPVNFCRAEPYSGTPLHRNLIKTNGLTGSFLGYNYRIEDDKTELLFRVCSSAFRQRNFDSKGVANRYMGLGYSYKILEHFYNDKMGRLPQLKREVSDLTQAISLETASFLEEATALVETFGHDQDRISRETAMLGLRIAKADQKRHEELDETYRNLEIFSKDARKNSKRASQKFFRTAQNIVISTSLTVSAMSCNNCRNWQPVDPPPPDYHMPGDGVPTPLPPDPVPPDTPKPPVNQLMPVDPPPPDPPPIPDPLPPDNNTHQQVTNPEQQDNDNPPPPIPDPAPPPTVHDPVPHDPRKSETQKNPKVECENASTLGTHFCNGSSSSVIRSTDLPLFYPPTPRLSATRDRGNYVVELLGLEEESASIRWESDGSITGKGRTVVWTPQSIDDQIRVAVRTDGGIAVVALRKCDLLVK